jgi:indolepyruvate ferredoxin oxidoreductase
MPLFRLLAKGKRLRGTALDLFGRTAERRGERQMIVDYLALLDRLTANLTSNKLTQASASARLVQEVRGYGHIKEAAVAAHARTLPARLAAYDVALPDPSLQGIA